MRRLPVYFLIDVSESMVGEPIHQVDEGLSEIIKALKTDPHAIETAWISIIVFAGQAKTLVPLQEVINFYPPKFPVGSGTSLSKGLGHLMYELRKNTVKNTYERKGDWKPIVFLFTDGVPTEDTTAAVQEWKQNWQREVNLIAVSFGADTDTRLLSELTENVLLFKNATPDAYKQFFRWVSDSIKTSSIGVEQNASGIDLKKIDQQTLSKIDLTKSTDNTRYVDNNYVILQGKCQNTKRPYLIKYQKNIIPSDLPAMDLSTLTYQLVGTYQVDQTYTELSDQKKQQLTVNAAGLLGFPHCPCCGNTYALALCSCKQIHCTGDNNPTNTCPHCGAQNTYGPGGSFDVGRTQG
ncbi:TerY-C metal binding domain-containing protein [Mucilaginibacter sp. CSA2-8R]|uniref:TerY-C metal binding domain-containing protein n=1 Tax=Mucilaginibacter sp. CSA2-8R TaxID=3141542 RepID=UPI00315C8CD9